MDQVPYGEPRLYRSICRSLLDHLKITNLHGKEMTSDQILDSGKWNYLKVQM